MSPERKKQKENPVVNFGMTNYLFISGDLTDTGLKNIYKKNVIVYKSAGHMYISFVEIF